MSRETKPQPPQLGPWDQCRPARNSRSALMGRQVHGPQAAACIKHCWDLQQLAHLQPDNQLLQSDVCNQATEAVIPHQLPYNFQC